MLGPILNRDDNDFSFMLSRLTRKPPACALAVRRDVSRAQDVKEGALNKALEGFG
jgi:hypothetical protein